MFCVLFLVVCVLSYVTVVPWSTLILLFAAFWLHRFKARVGYTLYYIILYYNTLLLASLFRIPVGLCSIFFCYSDASSAGSRPARIVNNHVRMNHHQSGRSALAYCTCMLCRYGDVHGDVSK